MDWIGVTIPLIACLFFTSLTVLVLVHRRATRLTRAFALFLFANVVWTFSSLLWHLTASMFWNRVLITGVVLVAASLAYFISEFLEIRRRMLLYAAEAGALVVLGLVWAGLVIADSYMEQGIARMHIGPGFPFALLVIEVIYVWSMAKLVQKYLKAGEPTFKYRIQYLVAGLAFQALGGPLNGVPGIGHLPIDIALAAVNASLIAFAILRHQLLDITVVIRRGVGYSVLTVGIATAYLLSVFALQRAFNVLLGPEAYILAALMALIFALFYAPAQRVLQRWVDRVFFRERYDTQRMVEELSQAVVSILSLDALGDLVVDRVMQTMSIRRGLLLVANRENGVFGILVQRGYPDDLDVTFERDHPVVQWLSYSEQGLFMEAIDTLPQFRGLLVRERRELVSLELELLVPIRYEGELIGILGLGPKLSDTPYQAEDDSALRTLANQLAVAIANARLVTDLENSLAEVRRMQEQLVQTSKLSAMGELVAGVAHELNNPLTAIKGYSQMLMDDAEMPASFRQDLERIDGAADRCSRIVRNLLLFARRREAQQQMCDLNRIVRDALALNEYQLKVDNIEIVLDLAQNLPATFADSHQLQQVFLNIITNAQQAMRQTNGGKLTIVSWSTGGLIHVSISDTGPGMAQEVRSRIFEPFFTTKTIGVGTGLGLAICYGIVKAHEGEILVQSAPGQGASFVVTLPVRRSEKTAEPLRPIQKAAVQKVHEVGKGRILAVDDEEDILSYLKKILEIEGFVVDVANTGLKALEYLHPERGIDYQIILTDLKMPGLDGFRLYSHLRSEKPGLERYVIFMSGDISSGQTMSFLEQTGRRYLVKPFSADALREAVYGTLSELSERTGQGISLPKRE